MPGHLDEADLAPSEGSASRRTARRRNRRCETRIVMIDFGLAPQRQRGELGGRREEGANRDVVVDDRIDERLGIGHRPLVELAAIDVDRATGFAEARRNGVCIGYIAKRARQHVLPRVKRHVKTSPRRIDLAAHFGADRGQRSLEHVMHDVGVVDLHIDDRQARAETPVGHLSARFG